MMVYIILSVLAIILFIMAGIVGLIQRHCQNTLVVSDDIEVIEDVDDSFNTSSNSLEIEFLEMSD